MLATNLLIPQVITLDGLKEEPASYLKDFCQYVLTHNAYCQKNITRYYQQHIGTFFRIVIRKNCDSVFECRYFTEHLVYMFFDNQSCNNTYLGFNLPFTKEKRKNVIRDSSEQLLNHLFSPYAGALEGVFHGLERI